MARKVSGTKLQRRKFLTGAVAAGAASALAPAARAATENAAPRAPSALPPSAQVAAAETQVPAALASSRIKGVPGSDFMVDVIKTFDIKYLPSNCASSFRGIHESLIDYGGNKTPEFL